MTADVVLDEAFRTAGDCFHQWQPKYWGEYGLGVDVKLFDGTGYVNVRVKGIQCTFRIAKQHARNFIRKYESYHPIPRLGVFLWVLPKSIFERIDDDREGQ